MPDHPLSEPYQKARKQHALFSGLLIASELMGFDITGTEYVSLKSPQAVPFVLLALVAYFAGRTSLEWWHLDEEARKPKPARIDVWSAHCIAGAAVGLYWIQRLLEIQVADAVTGPGIEAIGFGLMIGALPPFFAALLILQKRALRAGRGWASTVRWISIYSFLVIFWVGSIETVLTAARSPFPAVLFWSSLAGGFVLAFAVWFAVRRFVWSSRTR